MAMPDHLLGEMGIIWWVLFDGMLILEFTPFKLDNSLGM